MTVHLVTWFHADAARFKSTYSQTLGDSTSASHYAVYERCIRVFFASARRWNPSASLTLVTNVPTPQIFSVRSVDLLRRLDVRLIVVPNTHETPPGYYAKWQNQFYVLDVAAAAIRGIGDPSVDSDPVLILDSDCVITGPIDDEIVGPTGIAALVIPMAPDVEENGVSPRQLTALVTEYPSSAWSATADTFAVYLGGELVAARADVLRRVLQRADEAFAWSLARRAAGTSSLNEEAHLISLAVQTLGLQWRDATFIGRLWTQPWKFRTVEPRARDMTIWHLPAEKRTGISRLDRALERPSGWFWTAPNGRWRRTAGTMVGVPGYPAMKFVRDISSLVWARVRHAVARAR